MRRGLALVLALLLLQGQAGFPPGTFQNRAALDASVGVCSGWAPNNPIAPVTSGNLITWLKADVGVTGTSPVTGWADQSGSGNNQVVRSGFSGPTFNATAAGGKEGIVFTGGFNDALGQNSDSVVLGTGNKSSIFVLAQLTTGSQSLVAITSTGQAATPGTSANSWLMVGDASGPAVVAFQNSNVDPAVGKPFTLNTLQRLGYIYDGTNGTPYVNNSAGTATARNFSFLTPGRVLISTGTLVGAVREVIVYNTDLDSTNMGCLDAYYVGRSL